MKDLISVIVPIYNVEEYLPSCIESILRQTYSNLEIILVDDGSRDGSGILCDKYMEQDKRIVVIHQKNGGLSAARNSGLEIAEGEYVVFIDADDMIHPRMIGALYNDLKVCGADISICAHQCVAEIIGYKDVEESISVSHETQIYTGRECIKSFFDEVIGLDMIVVWNKLYKKEIFRTLRFPDGKIHEDEYINYKILYPMKVVSYRNQQLYYYRQRDNSIMNSFGSHEKRRQHISCMIDIYRQRLHFFKKKKDEELYGLMSIMFQRSLITDVIEIDGNDKEEKKQIKQLTRLCFWNFRKNIVKGRFVPLSDKMKGALFLLNKSVYKKLRHHAVES